MTFVSFAQNYEDVTLWRALRDVQDGVYIDIGAWDPDQDSVTRAFSERGWRGINIEPLPDKHILLQQRRPRDTNLPVAVGAAAGRIAFHVVEGTGLSTTDAAMAAGHAGLGYQVAQHWVEVETLADICAAHAPPTIHFLKVDCEGSEKPALEGADFQRFRPWIILVESTLPGTQIPSYAEWEPILLQARYRFAWFDGLNRFYVAAEHFDRLAPLLAVPPNIFDGFTRAVDMPSAADAPPAGPASADPAPTLTISERIDLAARCRDCDDVPKVHLAGHVQTDADGTRVQIMHNGIKVPADGYCGPWMTELITRCHGHHEPQEERQFHRVVATLPPDATMIELGGNWSYYTAWFLKDAPERRAVVLEPDPANRAVGERTMALNGLHAAFVAGAAGAATRTPAAFATERSGVMLLPTFSVPQLMVLHGMRQLHVLHCDVQGAEHAVLDQCQALFRAGQVRTVFVSTHAYAISGDPLTHHRCLDLLLACGATIEAEHDPWESFSGDGLIFARFGPMPTPWEPAPLSIARRREALFRDPLYDLANAFDALAQAKAAPPAGTAPARAQRPPVVPDDSPVSCTAVQLVLRQDTALGAAGDTVIIPNDTIIMPAVLRSGAWLPEHLGVMQRHIDPSCSHILLDIGANVGLFSRQVLRQFDNITLAHCVEPDPENYAALCQNMRGLGPAAVFTHQVALGDEAGTMTFFRDGGNCGNRSLHLDAMRGQPFAETTVDVAATAAWMDRHVIGQEPIIWKSDTQGNDEAIIAATPWRVWRMVEFAMIELWRIHKPRGAMAGFLARVADMPHRRIGTVDVSVEDVARYLDADDWNFEDLFLWR